jgi:hypothetical protein
MNAQTQMVIRLISDSGLAAQCSSRTVLPMLENPVPQATSINVWQLSSMQHEIYPADSVCQDHLNRVISYPQLSS